MLPHWKAYIIQNPVQKIATFAFNCAHMRPIYPFMNLRKLDIMGSSLQDFVCVENFLAVMFDFIYGRYDCYLRFYFSVLPLKLKRYSWPSVIIVIIIIILAKLR
jgi:hypothetical protein